MPAPLRLLLLVMLLLGAGLFAGRSLVRTHVVTGTAMLPSLWPGDRLLARPLRGGTLPPRGAIVLVRSDAGIRATRLVGLPGDRIAMDRDGLRIDGRRLLRFRVADLVLPASLVLPCPVPRIRGACRIARYREMARDGRSRDVLPGGAVQAERRVPPGHVLLLADARGGAVPRLVPAGALTARATMILWSSDRTVPWSRFWRWGETLRPGRILMALDSGADDDERRGSL